MRIIATILVFIIMLQAQLSVQKHVSIMIQKQAPESLITFKKLVKIQNNYREMGFRSADELDRMKLGQPLQVFMVHLDKLKEYQHDSDPDKMLQNINHFIYPVQVDNEVRSSLTITERESKPFIVSFGKSKLVQSLTKFRNKSAEANSLPQTSFFAVQIPALNLYFIGYSIENKLMLTPILDDHRFKFEAGVSEPADAIFNLLVPTAKRIGDFPT